MHMAPRAAAWVAWVEWTCNTGRGRPPPKAGDVEKERASARSFFVRASRHAVHGSRADPPGLLTCSGDCTRLRGGAERLVDYPYEAGLLFLGQPGEMAVAFGL
jgi:hypothetical protein